MAQKNPDPQKQHPAKDGLTPLMQQYREIKDSHPGTILFFRLGDFYEMFGDDAVKASPLLEVVLTKRQGMPMCGVPHHSVNAYIRKLIKAGERVAVCEQLEEPGAGRGIVRRGVVRVITPGTLLEDTLLDAKQNNYLVALFPAVDGGRFGLASVDISTGSFAATEVANTALSGELFKLSPGEIVVPQSARGNAAVAAFERRTGIAVTPLEDWYFSPPESSSRVLRQHALQSLKPLGLEGRPLACAAGGGILAYLEKTQVGTVPPLATLRYYSLDDHLLLDETAVRNLEIVENLHTKGREDTLLEAMDLTLTPMGGRTLRRWLLAPLLSSNAVRERQDAVAFFVEEGMARRTVREALKGVSDIERTLSRLSAGSAGPREMVSLKNSLELLPRIAEALAGDAAILPPAGRIAALKNALRPPETVIELIGKAIVDEPPATLKDGGVVRPGFRVELDELRTISRDSRELISKMEASERRRTGIATLKIGYTSVFGYYLEVSKSNLGLVPPDYIRKQTVAGGERFITPELKSFEEKVLSADEKILRLEEGIFRSVREGILVHAARLQEIAAAVAELDTIASFAEAAVLYRYVRPEVDESYVLEIREGRHPVVERRLKSGAFVSNDASLNGDSDQIILLTGPNMAGKSTYLRQLALTVVMAQAGSFVPCASARIGIVDRIFTRIGAGDNLSGGESTFMVEMHETANILNQNSPRSLIILDEMGRGTSTYDGISIAWSAIEFLAGLKKASGTGPKVLFATHYFERTDLAGVVPGVRNYNVAVKEWQGEVVFLHKIVPGAADRSYGIHVAQLAGLPREIIRRAYAILAELEQKQPTARSEQRGPQLELFSSPAPLFLLELDKLDLNAITPIEALQLLNRWKKSTENAPRSQ